VVNRNLEPFRRPKLLTIEVLIDHLVCSIPEILAVEWDAHDEETHAEHWLSLGKFDLALVRAIWGADITYVGDEHIKGTGGGCDDKVARTIVERNVNLRVIREIFIRLGDVRLKVFEE